MSVPFSPLAPRLCKWCQAPLQGRADKQFCSAACRGMAARHGASEGGPIDWQARAQKAEQTVHALQRQLDQWQHSQQLAEPFEQRYDEISKVVSVFVPELESLGSVANLLDYVAGLLDYYQQHPGLARGERGVQRRLQYLQWLDETLRRQYEALVRAKQRAAGTKAAATASTQGTPTPQ